jgi:hypothetical protein
MAEKIYNPKRTSWDLALGKCTFCPSEPATAGDNRMWRQKVYEHGHGYPPARNAWKTADGAIHRTKSIAEDHEKLTGLASSPLSQAQGATKSIEEANTPETTQEPFDFGGNGGSEVPWGPGHPNWYMMNH